MYALSQMFMALGLVSLLFSCTLGPVMGMSDGGLMGFGLLIVGLLMRLSTKQRPDVDQPSPKTHVRCPDCRELVHKQASVCKHCGCRLVPQ